MPSLPLIPGMRVHYDPNDADTVYRLGLGEDMAGRSSQAIPFLERAIALKPANSEFRSGLAGVCMAIGDWEQAEIHLDAGLDIDPESLEMINNRGLLHRIRQDFDAAQACFERALTIDPNYFPARENLDFLFKNAVPSWHFSMMHDTLRNEAYDKAIREAVSPETLVFEIGTGSGLLAMMAARAGAKQVVTTEVETVIAEAARQVVKDNGYEDRVTVLNKNSNQVELGSDLPEKADLLITETFDAGFLGEHAVPSIQHARQYLLKENAQILPRAGTIFACLLESRKLWEECAVDEAAGFDLKSFNKLRENISCKHVQNFPHRRLSPDFEVFHFDLDGPAILPQQKEIEVTVSEDGLFGVFVIWFRLYLNDHVVLETNIEDRNCWRMDTQILAEPLPLRKGQVVPLVAQHNCTWLRLRIKE